MTVVTISMPERLLKELDNFLKRQGFVSRSEILRQALRSFLVECKNLQEFEGEILATITVMYMKAEKNNEALDTQHRYENTVSAFLHSHVDEDTCIEVMIVRGNANSIRELLNDLKRNSKVTHVKMAVLGES